MTSALFDQFDGTSWRATELARGPWDPRACHGGPVSALLARAVEQLDDASDWNVARLTVELMRPVPVGVDLEMRSAIERPGRRVSLVGVALSAGGTDVAQVRALRIRHADVELTATAVEPHDPPPGRPESGMLQRVSWSGGDDIAFHRNACEHRFTEGSWDELGPVAGWIRLIVPVVDHEWPTPLQRVAAAADFGNGISAGVSFEHVTFINPDLTIHLFRLPADEWIGMRTVSLYGPDGRSNGTGLAESSLYDRTGRIGRSVQSLLVAGR